MGMAVAGSLVNGVQSSGLVALKGGSHNAGGHNGNHSEKNCSLRFAVLIFGKM